KHPLGIAGADFVIYREIVIELEVPLVVAVQNRSDRIEVRDGRVDLRRRIELLDFHGCRTETRRGDQVRREGVADDDVAPGRVLDRARAQRIENLIPRDSTA